MLNSPKAKKSLGQNFLVDPAYIDRTVNAIDPKSGDLIFEIGPGRGALTEKLLNSGAEIVAIELDRELIEPIRQRFVSKKLIVLERDALEANFSAIIEELNVTSDRFASIKLAANLPYYISTAILQRLADQRALFGELVLMFQREVVDRIASEPGNAERGYLTVVAESAFRLERLFDVPPEAFKPVPKVWSSVVRLTPKPLDSAEEGLKKLLSAGFAQKRKTISNNLKAAYTEYAAALEKAGIDPRKRAEQLSLDDWFGLNSAFRSLG